MKAILIIIALLLAGCINAEKYAASITARDDAYRAAHQYEPTAEEKAKWAADLAEADKNRQQIMSFYASQSPDKAAVIRKIATYPRDVSTLRMEDGSVYDRWAPRDN
jgi:plasmid stabilization system protein ParE